MLKRAAEIEGRTLTDFVVTAARDAAMRTIEEAAVIRLSIEDNTKSPRPSSNRPNLLQLCGRRSNAGVIFSASNESTIQG